MYSESTKQIFLLLYLSLLHYSKILGFLIITMMAIVYWGSTASVHHADAFPAFSHVIHAQP